MWVCLVSTIPVAMIGAPMKFNEPWGTIFSILILGAFLCAVLRLLAALVSAVVRRIPSGEPSQKRDGAKPNHSSDPEKRQ